MTPSRRDRERAAERYRPPAWTGIRAADVRALTLGDVSAGAARHRHYVALAVMILVVAVWFPGEVPIAQRFSPVESFTEVLDAEARADQATEVLAGGLERGSLLGAFSPPSDVVLHVREPVGPKDAGPVDLGPSGDDGDGEGPDGGGTQCPSDAEFEAGGGPAVAGPTVEQARAAQLALEEGIGRPFPVDLVGTVSSELGCEVSSASVRDLLVLGRLVPIEDHELVRTLAPIVAPACQSLRGVVLAEALATRRVSPALRDALGLCVASQQVRDAALPGAAGPQAGPVAPTAPARADEVVPEEPPTRIAPSWGPVPVFG